MERAVPARRSAVLRNLVVLDGSIVPTSLGINPSLTIAALAYRAIEHLRSEHGNGVRPPDAAPPVAKRPVFQDLSEPAKAVPTKAEIIERMSGDVPLPARGAGTIMARVELTMCFKPTAIESLVSARRRSGNVPMQRVGRRGSEAQWSAGLPRGGLAQVEGARRGREARPRQDSSSTRPRLKGRSRSCTGKSRAIRTRRRRALCAWIFNRGLRDIWQGVAQYIADWREGVPPAPLAPNARSGSLCKHLPFFKERVPASSATHPGAEGGRRRMPARSGCSRTTSRSPRPTADKAAPPGPIDVAVFAKKLRSRDASVLTYARRSNPWWQMTRMSLDGVPGRLRAARNPCSSSTRTI